MDELFNYSNIAAVIISLYLKCPKDWAQHAGLQAPDKLCSSQIQLEHMSAIEWESLNSILNKHTE